MRGLEQLRRHAQRHGQKLQLKLVELLGELDFERDDQVAANACLLVEEPFFRHRLCARAYVCMYVCMRMCVYMCMHVCMYM